MLTPVSAAQAQDWLGTRADAPPALKALLAHVRLFRVAAPHAPGLACIGCLVPLEGDAAAAFGAQAFSATGNGLDRASALISCLAEAAETLSTFERAGDLAPPGSAPALREGWIGAAMAAAGSGAAGPGSADWVMAHDAVAGRPVLLPADLCLRRRPERRWLTPAGALSAGTAAGPDQASAARRAMLELIERDAAALWWFGASPARRIEADDAEEQGAAALLARLRQGAKGRTTLLLDITTEIAVPAMLAASHDVEGFSLACGIAARLDRGAAMQAALLEMAQMELAIPLAREKLRRDGEAALSAADRRHLARAALHVPGAPPFRAPPSRAPGEDAAPARREVAARDDLAAALQRQGIAVKLVTHQRHDIGLPVVRAVSPDLQPFSQDAATPRLRACQAKAAGRSEAASAALSGILPF